ncbi:putative integral membrane protein conserved region-domain-containing protein, partial [Parasitella parasitica]
MPEVNSGNGIISGIQSYVSGSSSNSSNANLKKGLVYAILKHGTLFCFDSEKQQQVVMILPMQDFRVSLYPPNSDAKPEGEIYEDITCYPTRVLYLTCGRNIDKEDWYFGLLEAHHLLQDQSTDGPQFVMMDNTHFDQDALEELIRRVQSTPNHRETAWINAVLGRLFLGMYKTDRLQNFVEMKIRKKIDKTKRPTFLDEIHVRSVDVGASVPLITDPKLLSLSPEGEVIVEAKIEYEGGLTIEIETDFNWSYSSRMKPIRMNLILAVKLRRLAGRMMFKLKAPPTNRYWLAFFEMPEMDWKITPVVADKQIKLNIVTNAIESRIREVMQESFVLPNMDDTSFCPSGGKGGIFGEYV